MSQTKNILPSRLNLPLAAGCIALNLFQLFLLPLCLLPMSLWWGLLLIPLLPFNLTLWSLIHEAIHRMLHANERINERVGRLLAIQLGASLPILRFAHMMHHRYNRDWESELYDTDTSSWWKQAPGYYANLLGGLYLLEVLASLAFALVPVALLRHFIHRRAAGDESKEQAALRFFFTRSKITLIRTDMTAIAMLYGLSLYAYGAAFWPVWLAMVVGRALVISLFDNLYHYGTPADNSIPAREVRMPRALSILALNMHYHETHHRQAMVPWHRLPSYSTVIDDQRQDFAIAFFRQFSGPLPNSALAVKHVPEIRAALT